MRNLTRRRPRGLAYGPAGGRDANLRRAGLNGYSCSLRRMTFKRPPSATNAASASGSASRLVCSVVVVVVVIVVVVVVGVVEIFIRSLNIQFDAKRRPFPVHLHLAKFQNHRRLTLDRESSVHLRVKIRNFPTSIQDGGGVFLVKI